MPLEDKSISTGFLEACGTEYGFYARQRLERLTEQQLDTLECAKEFMERYERKNSKIKSQGSRTDPEHCELDRSE